LENNNFNIRLACEESKRCHEQQLNKHAAYWTGQGKSFEGGYYNAAYMHNNSNFPPRFLVAQSKRASGLVTVILTVQPPSSTEQNAGVGAPYFLQVIETAEMQTGQVTVNAQALSKGLAAEGKIALYGVYFDTNKSVILPTSKAQLDEMAAFLTQNKAVKVIVVGHTDNQGTTDGNLSLSQKRAEAVVHALVTEYKIDPQRLQSRGVANFSPVASNTSESGRSKNRRVELVEQ
jgi:outer membrane protein OmpA-like peptidoglycan-associated protein